MTAELSSQNVTQVIIIRIFNRHQEFKEDSTKDRKRHILYVFIRDAKSGFQDNK
jgi:hypothetical protein